MNYFSNTDNLFKQYSDLAQSKKRIEPKKSDKNDSLKEIVGYDQRFRSKKKSKAKPNQKMMRVPVSIAGMQHVVSVSEKEGESFILKLADRANHIIDDLRKGYPGLSMSDLTVLALINAMDQLCQCEDKHIELQKQYMKIEHSKKLLQAEYSQLQVVNKALTSEVNRLKDEFATNQSSSDDESSNCTSSFPLEDLLNISKPDTEEQNELRDGNEA